HRINEQHEKACRQPPDRAAARVDSVVRAAKSFRHRNRLEHCAVLGNLRRTTFAANVKGAGELRIYDESATLGTRGARRGRSVITPAAGRCPVLRSAVWRGAEFAADCRWPFRVSRSCWSYPSPAPGRAPDSRS